MGCFAVVKCVINGDAWKVIPCIRVSTESSMIFVPMDQAKIKCVHFPQTRAIPQFYESIQHPLCEWDYCLLFLDKMDVEIWPSVSEQIKSKLFAGVLCVCQKTVVLLLS